MKLEALKRIFTSQQIKTPEDFQKVLTAVPTKVFGIKFNNKYKLNSDVFAAATKGRPEVSIPSGVSIKIAGAGKIDSPVSVERGSVFKAPSLDFRRITSSAKKIVIGSTEYFASNTGKAKIGSVTGTNTAFENAKQIIGKMVGKNYSYDKSTQEIGHFAGTSKAFDDSFQYIYSRDLSNFKLEEHGAATIMKRPVYIPHPLDNIFG